MADKVKVYGKHPGKDGKTEFSSVEMDSIDARRAVKAHPSEWSLSPWNKDADADAAAAKAKADADAKAKADADAAAKKS